MAESQSTSYTSNEALLIDYLYYNIFPATQPLNL